MQNIEQTIPISLYIHMPWCIRKCPYCDFNSHTADSELPESSYFAKLMNELTIKRDMLGQRTVHSIFIGGGTPSLMHPDHYAQLLITLAQTLTLAKDCEITLEANPGTTDQQRFQGYRSAGINRLSLGIQSFQDDKLKALGRIHSAKQALQAVSNAQHAGFENINIDLMYGLPEQSITDALLDLQTATQLGTMHLSWYQLTLEPNTYFHRFPPTLPNDDLIWEMQQQGKKYLAAQKFNHYEISAYCQSSYFCQHNLNYWKFGDYLGIGAGAHSKITCPQTYKIIRHWNVKNPRDYLNPEKNVIANQHQLHKKELLLEFMLNALRLQRPIPLDWLTQRTGLTLQDIERPVQAAIQAKLLILTQQQFITTELGKRYLNELLELFL